VWSKETLAALVGEVKKGKDVSCEDYPDSAPDVELALRIQGVNSKSLMVGGSISPWIESVALALGTPHGVSRTSASARSTRLATHAVHTPRNANGALANVVVLADSASESCMLEVYASPALPFASPALPGYRRTAACRDPTLWLLNSPPHHRPFMLAPSLHFFLPLSLALKERARSRHQTTTRQKVSTPTLAPLECPNC
jgi:hypothetical protein